MKAYRLIEYDGPEEWVQRTLVRSLDGTWTMPTGGRITATLIEMPTYPTIQQALRVARTRPATWPAQDMK